MLLLLDDLAEVYMYEYVQFLLCKYADEGHDFEQIWLQNRRKILAGLLGKDEVASSNLAISSTCSQGRCFNGSGGFSFAQYIG